MRGIFNDCKDEAPLRDHVKDRMTVLHTCLRNPVVSIPWVIGMGMIVGVLINAVIAVWRM